MDVCTLHRANTFLNNPKLIMSNKNAKVRQKGVYSGSATSLCVCSNKHIVIAKDAR